MSYESLIDELHDVDEHVNEELRAIKEGIYEITDLARGWQAMAEFYVRILLAIEAYSGPDPEVPIEIARAAIRPAIDRLNEELNPSDDVDGDKCDAACESDCNDCAACACSE